MKERESHHKGPEEREVDNLCGRYRVSTLPFSRVKFMSLRHFSTAHPFHCSSLNFKKVDLGLVYFFASWFHLFRKENWCNPNMNNHLNCYQLLQACIFHQIFQIRVISLRVGMRGVNWLGWEPRHVRRVVDRPKEERQTERQKVKGNEQEGLICRSALFLGTDWAAAAGWAEWRRQILKYSNERKEMISASPNRRKGEKGKEESCNFGRRRTQL